MKQDREQALLAALAQAQRLSLSDAMQLLNTSESTVRRMFAKLEQDGLAIRTHGGIQGINHAMTLYSFEHGTRTNMERKNAIGRKACELVEDGDVIFCDSGTTIQSFCSALIYAIQERQLHIKVYTNSLANLELLADHMPVTLVGGEYRANRKDFCGYLSEQALAGLYFNKSFVGADGCTRALQFTTTDFETASMNQVAMRNSERSILLADSSKFSVNTHVIYAPVQALYAIVTDDQVPASVLSALKGTQARILCADTKASETSEIHEQKGCSL